MVAMMCVVCCTYGQLAMKDGQNLPKILVCKAKRGGSDDLRNCEENGISSRMTKAMIVKDDNRQCGCTQGVQ
jgi:hypothetical protein